jgi:hypothetical protein
MDKRSESQFVAAAAHVKAPSVVEGKQIYQSGTTSVYSGTPQDVMKNVAAQGRNFQRHNEGPRSLLKEGDLKWKTDVQVSTRPGGPPADTTKKEGRRAVAKDLGLPNKKEFRAKKKKG